MLVWLFCFFVLFCICVSSIVLRMYSSLFSFRFDSLYSLAILFALFVLFCTLHTTRNPSFVSLSLSVNYCFFFAFRIYSLLFSGFVFCFVCMIIGFVAVVVCNGFGFVSSINI
uniref:Putative secreted peptide n=1 Tax=Anopheles braziliensis TaxID=58242 RepID=A0A2M3ZRZ0_9DIPT